MHQKLFLEAGLQFTSTNKQTKKLKQPNLQSKGIRKRRTNKAQDWQKERRNKDQRRNKTETKK